MPILVVTTETTGMDKYSQELAERLGIRQVASRRYMSFTEAFRFARFIRSEPDILHLPNQHFARFAVVRRNPFIVTVHDMVRLCLRLDKEPIMERIFLKLDKAGIRRASHIIAISQHTRNDLIKYLGIPEDKITVIYNGIDYSIFKPRRAKPPENPYILYVGSERPRKNLDRLLEAFVLIRNDI